MLLAQPGSELSAFLTTCSYGLIGKSCNLALGCYLPTNNSDDSLCGRRAS